MNGLIRPTLLAALARVARASFFFWGLVLAAGGGVGIAQAQTPAPAPAPDWSAGLEARVSELALAATRSGVAGVSRVEVAVGALDPRLRLAPCARIEPYLPPTVRLWGRSRIGLRCVDGPSAWNVYLPITVKVYGPALVATALLPAGSVLGAADVSRAEVDLAEDSAKAATDSAVIVGRTLARALKPGQTVRQTDLRARQWFAAGDTVKLIAHGPGFSVAGEGQALTHGVEGEPVRVRIEGGRTVTGQAVGERRVEMAL